MTTLTIELPPKLKQQLQNRGISNQQLTVALTKLIELYLNNYALQQTLTVMDDIFQQTAIVADDNDEKRAVSEQSMTIQLAEPNSDTGDPILQLGTQPIMDDITDASINHDRYLYP